MTARQIDFSACEHTVCRLAPDLLLVFKPRGHREQAHAHPYAQKLRVLRGRLLVEAHGAREELSTPSESLTIDAETIHATEALEDTWLVVDIEHIA